MRHAILICLAAAAVASAAHAQDRAPAERQQLAELAYVLGESHALRQTCNGKGDMYWRARMQDMLQVEAADQGFSYHLTQAFNSGYAAGRTQYPYCDASARAELRHNAQRGRALAAHLSGP